MRSLQSRIDDLETRGLRRTLRVVSSSSGRTVTLDGRDVVNFSSNNYLGLANHPALIDATIAAAQHAGAGSTASRLIVGNLDVHQQLERELAAFHGRAAALLFNSGYHANLGVLPALARGDDVIFSDALNHASIIDGCRLSQARVVVFPHNDMAALRSAMRAHAGVRRFVVTDTVFSMDGDLARLDDLAELCAEQEAALVIDDAHAVGALGPGGQGMAAAAGVIPDVHVATLGKAFGSFGAYVAGESAMTELLLNQARSFVFTTALPPGVIAASRAALTVIQGPEGAQRRARLGELMARFRTGLAERGLLAPGAGHSAIFPVMIGDEARTMACSEQLLERGIYAQGIRPPTVAKGTARLRFALMATHTDDDIELALQGLDELATKALIRKGGPTRV
jgi:8-amino-7-oxononanoate synthase